MIQKKVCMLGTFAVGKTSLVSRFVRSMFSDKYHTTVGVKIDKKVMRSGDHDVTLVLWDIHGEDDLQKIRMSYVRGAAGYILVVDGTRHATLDLALTIQMRVEEELGKVPFIVVLNKSDLVDEWEIDDETLAELSNMGRLCIKASAKTGEGVEETFAALAAKMMEG